MPWRAEAQVSVGSGTQTFSLRVVEDGLANLDGHVAVAHRIPGADSLAVALRATRQKSEADPMAEHRRERDRRHIAFVVGGDGLRACAHEVSAGSQALLEIERLQADEGRTVSCHQAW